MMRSVGKGWQADGMEGTFAVLDGGMGRELLRVGAPFRQPEWSASALIEGPEWVVQAHPNVVDAGADLITTNSYAVVPFHIGSERFDAEGALLAGLSGRLARQAAGDADRCTVAYSSDTPANAGLATFYDDLDPDAHGESVEYWVASGVSIVGGCCGMEPDHIAHLARVAHR